MAAFVFCFLLPAGDYVTPLLVGGKVVMIGNMVATQFGKFFNWPWGRRWRSPFWAAVSPSWSSSTSR